MQNARNTSSVNGAAGSPAKETARLCVHALADSSDKLSGICAILDHRFAVAGERLDAPTRLTQVPFAVVIRADLRDVGNITAIKLRAARLAKATKRIFLL